MLERIKCCLCYPRFIGKFFKDKVGTIILTILFFIISYGAILGVKCYSSDYFDDESILAVTSNILQGESSNVKYDKDTYTLTGSNVVYKGDGFVVTFFPVEGSSFIGNDVSVNIVFDSTGGYIDFAGYGVVSEFSYKDINAGSFSISAIQKNDINAIYNFKVMLYGALNTSSYFFNTYDFALDFISNVSLYFVFVLICFFFSKGINPTIDKKVRVKLCFYDNLIYFVVCLVNVMVSVELLDYVGLILPLIFTFITFRHIVRVPVNK